MYLNQQTIAKLIAFVLCISGQYIDLLLQVDLIAK